MNKEKHHRLIEEAIREFSDYGYTGASTNRIVRRVGISKGSLSYYFESKKQLYVTLLDRATEEVCAAVSVATQKLPEEPVERVVALARAEFGFYAYRPELYRLLRRAVSDPDTERMVRERYADSGMALFSNHLSGAKFALAVDESTAISLLAWIVNGFNEAFMPTVRISNDPETVLRRYETGLRSYLSVVAPCVCGITDSTDKGGEI